MKQIGNAPKINSRDFLVVALNTRETTLTKEVKQNILSVCLNLKNKSGNLTCISQRYLWNQQ